MVRGPTICPEPARALSTPTERLDPVPACANSVPKTIKKRRKINGETGDTGGTTIILHRHAKARLVVLKGNARILATIGFLPETPVSPVSVPFFGFISNS